MDLHAGAVPRDQAVPDGSEGKWTEESLLRGPQCVYQKGISHGQEDGCKQGVFLYSERRSTAGGGVANVCMPGGDGAVGC